MSIVFPRLVEGGVKEETKQILQNLDTVLQAANSSMKQVLGLALAGQLAIKDVKNGYTINTHQ